MGNYKKTQNKSNSTKKRAPRRGVVPPLGDSSVRKAPDRWMGLDEYDEGDADEVCEGKYYEDGEYVDEAREGEYYEDEEYSDEAYEGEFYEDEEYPEDAGEDEYYEDEYYDDDVYDDGYYEDQADDGYRDDYSSGKSSFLSIVHNIGNWFSTRTTTDFLLIGGGLAVVIMLIFGGVFFFGNEVSGNRAAAAMADAGNQLSDVEVIGQQGLLAATNAKVAEAEALLAVIDEDDFADEDFGSRGESPEETNDGRTVVIMNLTSIQRDLKIKFVNNETQKLITGVPFEVSIKDPSGSSSSKTNNDKDGIIYLKNITPGKYQVTLKGPTDGYNFSTDAVSITVKDTIEYKKVDVAAEIKSEKEINAAAEDTAKKDTEIEGSMTDTVEYVESTKTLISGSGESKVDYELVGKDNIADPAKSAYLGMRLLSKKAEPGENPDPGENPEGDPTPEPTPTTEPEPTPTPEEPTPEPTPEETPVSTPTQEPTPTPASTPTPTPSAASTPTPSATPTPTASATPTATPTATPDATERAKKDTTSTLKTTGGATVYVKDSDGMFRVATYADYYKASEFFVQKKTESGEYKYTGWQTIDGSTYYFDKNGNKVTGDQVIKGAKYTFGSDGKLSSNSGVLGIDVSKWNGSIDWNAVKNSGVSFVIIRLGYRGSTVGALVDDVNFKTNINGAINAGLKVGVYFFTQAVNEVEAVEEASMVLNRIKGYNISFPVFLDVESSGGRADSISTETRTAVCRAFCQTIQNSGYKAGIYANKSWFNSKINAPDVSGYKIWLAQYAAAPTYNRTRYDMWQYSSKGSVPGISGNVDMNISYLGY